MSRSEVVEFNGIKFRRYPESQDASLRNYFRPAIHLAMRGVESLHREVWKATHGPIPSGWHVHHVDGDHTNNDVGNLECLPPFEHLSHHGRQEPSQRKLEHLASVRHLAAAWHSSPEGLAWHAAHGRSTWAGRKSLQRRCDRCGSEYESKDARASLRFCSNSCKTASRFASGVDDVPRSCIRCGSEFLANKYRVKRFCSRSCSAKFRHEKPTNQ